jgi:tRNA-binding protein
MKYIELLDYQNYIKLYDTCVFAMKTALIMENTTNELLQWSEFEKAEMRIGTILEVNDFPEARKPAFQLLIDFGAQIGIRKSSAQITKRYSKEDLIGKQIVAVVNFPRKQIGTFMSECLVLGSVGTDNDIVLLTSDLKVENGLRIG